jgi:hypothetical protein
MPKSLSFLPVQKKKQKKTSEKDYIPFSELFFNLAFELLL